MNFKFSFFFVIAILFALYVSFDKVDVDEISPLEMIVKQHESSIDDVVYLYMYKGTDDYKTAIEAHLRWCSEGKIKRLAFSTFDEETEHSFLSLLNESYKSCYLIFYGTRPAVEIVKSSFSNGIFISGDLKSNARVKRLYDAE